MARAYVPTLSASMAFRRSTCPCISAGTRCQSSGLSPKGAGGSDGSGAVSGSIGGSALRLAAYGPAIHQPASRNNWGFLGASRAARVKSALASVERPSSVRSRPRSTRSQGLSGRPAIALRYSTSAFSPSPALERPRARAIVWERAQTRTIPRLSAVARPPPGSSFIPSCANPPGARRGGLSDARSQEPRNPLAVEPFGSLKEPPNSIWRPSASSATQRMVQSLTFACRTIFCASRSQ
jgi:hypothetical protein